MPRKKPKGRRRPIGRIIEILEPRDLPSAVHALAGAAEAHARVRSAAAESAHTDASSPAGTSSPTSPNATFTPGSTQLNLAGAASTSSSTVTQNSGTPTPHERARENFTAVFYGPSIIGPPRFSGDLSQAYTTSGGSSSAFLHGNLQLGFQTPSSASQGPTGTATLFPKNDLMTGSYLSVQIQGAPNDSRDGRATSFNWTVGSSRSGMFSNASGSGTIQLIYHPGGADGGVFHAQGWGSGNVSVIFRGTLVLDGTVNPLRLGAA